MASTTVKALPFPVPDQENPSPLVTVDAPSTLPSKALDSEAGVNDDRHDTAGGTGGCAARPAGR